jgi:hypothetical protein
MLPYDVIGTGAVQRVLNLAADREPVKVVGHLSLSPAKGVLEFEHGDTEQRMTLERLLRDFIDKRIVLGVREATDDD